MKENLIQTSSIFSKGPNSEPEVLESPDLITELTEESHPEEPRCRTLKFDATDANIGLRHFFPDSLNCVIYNKLSDKFFAGQMGEELIYEVPISKYAIIAVTDKMVVLQIWTGDLQEEETVETKFMVLYKDTYELKEEFDYNLENTIVTFEGSNYNLLTTEISEPETNRSGSKTTYFYEKGNIVIEEESSLYFEDERSKAKVLLLADATGSYLGYYLPKNQDGTINLHGRRFRMVQRLTLTLAVVEDLETEEEFLLTCATQVLLKLSDFGISNYLHISILNGVALLMDETPSGTVLNVFTPNHQRIVLEPGYKVNDNAFGNGLYFEKDNVLLLDNGSLTFTERVSKDVVSVKGKEIKIPTEHLGDL